MATSGDIFEYVPLYSIEALEIFKTHPMFDPVFISEMVEGAGIVFPTYAWWDYYRNSNDDGHDCAIEEKPAEYRDVYSAEWWRINSSIGGAYNWRGVIDDGPMYAPRDDYPPSRFDIIDPSELDVKGRDRQVLVDIQTALGLAMFECVSVAKVPVFTSSSFDGFSTYLKSIGARSAYCIDYGDVLSTFCTAFASIKSIAAEFTVPEASSLLDLCINRNVNMVCRIVVSDILARMFPTVPGSLQQIVRHEVNHKDEVAGMFHSVKASTGLFEYNRTDVVSGGAYKWVTDVSKFLNHCPHNAATISRHIYAGCRKFPAGDASAYC